MSTISDGLRKAKRIEILLEIDFQGMIRRYAARDLTVPESGGEDRLFKAAFLNPIEIKSSYDIRTMTYAARSVAVEIANRERLQDQETGRTLDGAVGNIYVWAPGLDWADIESAGLIYSGVFEKTSHDKDVYAFQLKDLWEAKDRSIPENTINTDAWPNLRTEGGDGSVASKASPLVLGTWTKGIPLRCVDTVAFKYLAHLGMSKTTNAEYAAGTYDVFDKDGGVIAPAGYTFYPGGVDGEGNTVAYFDFTADQSANEPLSCGIRGVYDGSGIITGTSDAIIEHPADIVRYLLEHHSGFGSSGIHLESLKTMKSVLPGLKFATLINDRAKLSDILNRLLSQALCSGIIVGDQAGVLAMSLNAPARQTMDGRSRAIGRTLKISRTPGDDVCNKARVRYALNPSTGEYEGELTGDRTNNETAKRSYYDYGESPERELYLPDVQSEAGAIYIVNRLLDLKSRRHDIVEIEAPYWDAIDLREGDAAELNVEEGPSRDGGGWTAERCILIERSFKRHTILQKWWRVGG